MKSKEQLIESASEVIQPESGAALEYEIKILALIDGVNQLMLQRKDIVQLVGENNLEMMKNNHANHARFIASIMLNYDPEILVESILWVFRAYQSHGFSSNYWPAQLNVWLTVLENTLTPESFRQIQPLYQWMIVNIPMFELFKNQPAGN